MKFQTLLNFAASAAASVAFVGAQVLPAAAQSTVQSAGQSTVQSAVQSTPHSPLQSTIQTRQLQAQTITIPATTGIVISFLAPVSIDAGEAAYPLTVPLSQAITDPQGNVIVAENSPVSIVIQPEAGGAKIVAQSILINGQIVPVQATSPVIPGTTVVHVRANDRAADNGATIGRIVGSGWGFINGGDPDAFDQGGMLGSFVGMLSGRQDESTRVVQIPQGSVYVLSLEEAIHLR